MGDEPLLFNIDLYHGPLPLNQLIKLNIIPKVFSSYITLAPSSILYNLTPDIEKISIILDKSYRENWRAILYSPQFRYTQNSDEFALGELKLVGNLKNNGLSFKINSKTISYERVKTQQNKRLNIKQLNIDYMIADILTHQQEKLQLSIDKLNLDLNDNGFFVDQLQLQLLENTEKEYRSALLLKNIMINIFEQTLSSDELLIDEQLLLTPVNDKYINNIKLSNIILNKTPFGSIKWLLTGEADHNKTQHISYNKLKELVFNGKITEFSYSLLKSNPKIENRIDWVNTGGKATLKSSYLFDTIDLSGIETDRSFDYIEPVDIILTSLQQAKIKLAIDKKMLQELNNSFNLEKGNQAIENITEEQFVFGINMLNQYFGQELSLIDKKSLLSEATSDVNKTTTLNPDKPIEFIINDKDKITADILYEKGVFTIKNEKYSMEN